MVVAITPMTEADWPRVREIYAAGLATGQASFETEAPAWEAWDARHHAEPRLIAREDGEVVGWAAVSPVSERHCYRGVAEVRIYVDPSRSGEGIGTALLGALVAESEAAGFWTLQSAVFPENTATLSLHRRHGFREVGRRERIAQHHGIWRDTVFLERRSPAVGR